MKVQLSDIHFQILNISRTASKEEIKRAYVTEIKKWHPDKFADDPEKIFVATEKSKAINEAYSLLKDYDPPKSAKAFYRPASSQQTEPSATYRSAQPKKPRINVVRVPVQSSNVVSIGYDNALKILQVEYKGGTIYQYYDVPGDLFEQLMRASSKGRFLNASIKWKYRCD